MPNYRFLIGDMVTGQIVTEVDCLDAVRFDHSYNQGGTFNATLAVWGTKYTWDQIQPPRACFLVDKDGTLIFGGPIKTLNPSDEGVAITGRDGHDYLARRDLRFSLTFSAVDQALIVKALIDHAQTVLTFQTVNFDTSGISATGITRDRTYLSSEAPYLGDLVLALSNVDNGFDYWVTPRYEDSSKTSFKFIPNIYYPAFGEETSLTFASGAESVSTLVTDDTWASLIKMVGGGIGFDAVRLAASGLNYGTLELDKVIRRPDITTLSGLFQVSTREVILGSANRFTYTVTDIDPRYLGSLRPGQRATVRVTYGDLVAITDDVVITRVEANLPADGLEEIIVTASQIGLFL